MSRDLLVLSHLRWTFVWQRPQHLISRIAAGYDHCWFVEEPEPTAGLAQPRVRSEDAGPVTRVWLQVPDGQGAQGFDPSTCEHYAETVKDLGVGADVTAWLYTPMALPIVRQLGCKALIYDVMDDLAAFRFAPAELVLRQRQALREADVVFTGGRSLYRSVADQRPDAHCFPSGVEPEHFSRAIALRNERPRGRPVAGYIGVIDERVDLDLIASLADHLPDWEIRIVGPVLKIDCESLPQRPNLTYPGPCDYAALPSELSTFDVALMPFALNEATRSISPTKTLEYLAAGLPVVSTAVPDVVADYDGIVDVRDDGAQFAAACRAAFDRRDASRAQRVRNILRAQRWDSIAARMADRIGQSRAGGSTAQETA